LTPTTLLLGLGNTLLTDEAVGPLVVGRMQAADGNGDVGGDIIRYLDGGTLSFTLAGPIADCDRLIVVDAAAMGAPPGTVRVFEGAAMDHQLRLHAKTVHEVSLADLFDIARLTDSLPTHRALVGIEPQVVDWGNEPTPVVHAAIPSAIAKVRELLARWNSETAVP
jgi:hydrogenase maturation protease